MLLRIQGALEEDREGLSVELNELLEVMVDLGIYPSKYQRVDWYEPGLTAQPLWKLDELGNAGTHLANLESNWELLREEAIRLVDEHNWNIQEGGVWTRGEEHLEQNGRWQQLVFSGLGYPELPEDVCSTAPTLCSLAAASHKALACPFGQIKLSVLQA